MTVTLEKTKAHEVRCHVNSWLARLNQQEQERRKEVNAKHVAEYGRLLYPHGGQYATFYLDRPGRKYTRVVMEVEQGGGRSVHAFVDLATGDVYKAAGWGKPASGIRFNLLDRDSRERMFSRLSFNAGYLYR